MTVLGGGRVLLGVEMLEKATAGQQTLGILQYTKLSFPLVILLLAGGWVALKVLFPSDIQNIDRARKVLKQKSNGHGEVDLSGKRHRAGNGGHPVLLVRVWRPVRRCQYCHYFYRFVIRAESYYLENGGGSYQLGYCPDVWRRYLFGRSHVGIRSSVVVGRTNFSGLIESSVVFPVGHRVVVHPVHHFHEQLGRHRHPSTYRYQHEPSLWYQSSAGDHDCNTAQQFRVHFTHRKLRPLRWLILQDS